MIDHPKSRDLANLVDDALDAERIQLPQPTRARLVRRLTELLEEAGYDDVIAPTSSTT